MFRQALVFVALLWAGSVSAQTISLDCESGNRSIDAANCWVFPGTSFTNLSNVRINGTYSAQTGQLTGTPNGVISPWFRTNGNSTITFKHKLSGTGLSPNITRKLEVVMQTYQQGLTSNFPEVVLWTYNYTNANAVTIQTETINIGGAVSGARRIYLRFTGVGGSLRGVLDDISFSSNVEYYSDPANNCLPKVETPPPPQFLDTKLANNDYTLLFEDMWPSYGDYDFNDLVVDYNWVITSSTAAGNPVTKARYTFKLRAMGAGNDNGFAFQLDGISPSAIASVSGARLVGNSLIQLNGNGTEKGQQFAVIPVFDKGKSVMPSSGGTYVNTEAGKAAVAPVSLTIDITFTANSAVSLNTLQQAFNPFLIVNQNRQREIHLANFAPTTLADRSVFGQKDDNSSANWFYRAKNNSPWALSVPASIPYPRERQLITKAFSIFANWVKSSGSTGNDWYMDKSDYRNQNFIYKP